MEPLSLKFGSYSLYGSLSGQFASSTAFLEFEFDLYSWLFFEFVDVRDDIIFAGLLRTLFDLWTFLNGTVLHGIWCPFWAFL